MGMHILGIDLAGPSNTESTCGVLFETFENQIYQVDATYQPLTDPAIIDIVQRFVDGGSVVVGIDAPLSYNLGGGDRLSDRDLRRRIIEVGLHPGSVMPPTMNRMVYLTLRGVVLARGLNIVFDGKVMIVEVHPKASMALRGGPIDALRMIRQDPNARECVLQWLEDQGVKGLNLNVAGSDHYVSACACAFAAWRWSLNQSVWCFDPAPPFHPYPFAC